MNKKALGGVAIVVIIILLLLAVVMIYNFTDFSQTDSGSQESARNTGRVVFALTDAAANLESVSSIKMTVDSVSAHSTNGNWITVSSTSRTYDLLELKSSGEFALLADTKIDSGNYNQIRLDISKVVVVDEQGTQEAKMPSNELKINGNFDVREDSTAAVTFDFIVDESLHTTGNGKYIMAPVVQYETKENAEVEVRSNNKVEIRGGTTKTSTKVGMDINGNVGVGLKIPSASNITIDSDNIIRIGLLGT